MRSKVIRIFTMSLMAVAMTVGTSTAWANWVGDNISGCMLLAAGQSCPGDNAFDDARADIEGQPSIVF